MSGSSDRDTQHSHQTQNLCTAEQKVFDCIFAVARSEKKETETIQFYYGRRL